MAVTHCMPLLPPGRKGIGAAALPVDLLHLLPRRARARPRVGAAHAEHEHVSVAVDLLVGRRLGLECEDFPS